MSEPQVSNGADTGPGFSTRMRRELPDARRKHLVRNAINLLSSPQLADTKLQCGPKTWYINEAWLCACGYDLATRLQKERGQGMLKFARDHVPSAVGAMMHYLYCGDYDEDDYDVDDFDYAADSSPLLFNLYVHDVACELQVPGLEILSGRRFEELARKEATRLHYSTAVREVYSRECLEDAALLRGAVIEGCAPYAQKILGPEKWLTPGDRHVFAKLRKATSEIEEFAQDLKKKVPALLSSGHDCTALGCVKEWHRCGCPNCFRSCKIQGMVLQESTIVYCPHCGSGGCDVISVHGRT